MNTPATPLSTFVCPACHNSVAVDERMKTTIVERGCVVCGATVAATAFERTGAGTGTL
jgi:ribosomal protein L37AE/L43A